MGAYRLPSAGRDGVLVRREGALVRVVCAEGEDDMLPALDVAYLKLVGALAGLGRRATEDEVRAFFAPYEEHAALAGLYALHRGYS